MFYKLIFALIVIKKWLDKYQFCSTYVGSHISYVEKRNNSK